MIDIFRSLDQMCEMFIFHWFCVNVFQMHPLVVSILKVRENHGQGLSKQKAWIMEIKKYGKP